MNVTQLSIIFSIIVFCIAYGYAQNIFHAFRPDQKGGSYFFRETKNEKGPFYVLAIRFVWRKKYKQLIALITLVLSFGIVWLDTVVATVDIEAKDELTALVLTVTAGILFWYTRETDDLKQNSNKELKRLDAAEMNKFLPIVIPASGTNVLELNGNINARLVNVGKGIAQDVYVQFRTQGVVPRGFTSDVWGPHVLMNNEGTDGKRFSVSDSSVKESLVNVIGPNDRPEKLTMIIKYNDIFGRLHKTTGLIEYKVNKYHVDAEKWRFKQEHALPDKNYILSLDSEEVT